MSKIRLEFNEDFQRQLTKLPKNQREEVVDAIELFLADPKEPSLRIHALKAEWSGYHSISACSDLRLHFKIRDEGTVVYFVAVGTHSQLYK